MKTAMQEFIEYLEKAYYINELTNFDKDKIQFLEKEKEQIIDAYENGVGDENERNLSGNFTNAEQYYNQTYKPETI
jgi:hypothetical protein